MLVSVDHIGVLCTDGSGETRVPLMCLARHELESSIGIIIIITTISVITIEPHYIQLPKSSWQESFRPLKLCVSGQFVSKHMHSC